MKSSKLLIPACLMLVALAAALTNRAIADATTDVQLPAGWTPEDMQACIAAATPGPEHALLAKDVGEWTAKTTMWMSPDADPVESTGSMKVTPILDGRFMKIEMQGEMPGMGPYMGGGTCGYDNVLKKYVATWMDNWSTAIMVGEGEASADGKTLTWTYTASCPIAGKQVTVRQVETVTGPDTKTLEMFGPDPKTGKEFKTMKIELTRD